MPTYCATIGFFDGVHRGHRFLIGTLLSEAARRGLDSALVTFESHPAGAPLLTTFDERVERLRETGVTEIFCFQYPLVREFTAREFMLFLRERCAVTVLLMGYDHRFGSDLRTPGRTLDDYVREGQEVGVEVVPVPRSPEGDMSSSRIRRALSEGRIEDANAMLGYAYTLTGTVTHGRGLGRTLGFPTANIDLPATKLLPLAGVYACDLSPLASDLSPLAPQNPQSPNNPFLPSTCYLLPETSLPAIVNIGTNPTLGDNPVTVEVHIPGFSDDLYGRVLELRLMRRIRDERRFGSLDDLRAQIEADVRSLDEK